MGAGENFHDWLCHLLCMSTLSHPTKLKVQSLAHAFEVFIFVYDSRCMCEVGFNVSMGMKRVETL